ncbi:endonuclease/exonuclease/phosphatase family protein [Flavivirga spongiicola]|uniref:Endonuclease/exonuclease/phosphatase family protein n=1 Tax=Flavivirga spongiicola TaxID=421621 RepID=A0ABU7XXD9_9FLAO|nr:endonuclease/exonuclease/phosphatase family protein [Flavivirga sp. MEBiC05379]MDO5980442.1 endonuclease/exonuclease/phosphatase family protein [Flavivirga sp. MEBiC05379]
MRFITYVSSFVLTLGCILAFNDINLSSFVFIITIPVLFIINLLLLFYWIIRKKKAFLFPLLSLLIYSFLFDSFFQINSKREEIEDVSILTYNAKGFSLDYVTDNANGNIADFIKEKDADIVCIQEFFHKKIPDFEIYPYRFWGYRPGIKKSLSVIFSKYPILETGFIDFPNTVNNGIYADIAIKNKKIRIYNLHLQSFGINLNSDELNDSSVFEKVSKTLQMQAKQSQIINDKLNAYNGFKIVCGDFNSTSFSSVYKTIKGSLQDTFVERGFGLGTTYNLLHYPLRLDFVLIDNNFEAISHENYSLGLSDHDPIFVKLKYK